MIPKVAGDSRIGAKPTAIATATTLPSNQTLDVSLVGGMTGFELAFRDTGGAATPMGGRI